MKATVILLRGMGRAAFLESAGGTVANDQNRLVPQGAFLSGRALEKLPDDKPIVLHCKVGGRSAEVLAVVKGAGYADAVHVGGGVVAWVNQIEPEKPNY